MTKSRIKKSSFLRGAWARYKRNKPALIGLGIQPPTPEWGSMLAEAQNYLRIYPNSVIWPGIIIILVNVALSLIGNGMSEAMDPQMKE